MYSISTGDADYEWLELWKAIIALLEFLAGKLEHLATTGGIENLVQEVGDGSNCNGPRGLNVSEILRLVGFAVSKADIILATANDIHVFIVRHTCYLLKFADRLGDMQYELVRSSHVMRKQAGILQMLGQPGPDRRTSLSVTRSLKRVLSVISYYEGEISRSGAQTAKESLRVVSRLVDKDGMHGAQERHEEEDPR